jgi:hypothetical protein
VFGSIHKANGFVEIMLKQITPEGAIRFIWFSVALSFSWPLSDDSSRSRVLGFRVLQISAVVNAFLMLVTLIYSFSLNLDNMTALFRCIFQVIIPRNLFFRLSYAGRNATLYK